MVLLERCLALYDVALVGWVVELLTEGAQVCRPSCGLDPRSAGFREGLETRLGLCGPAVSDRYPLAEKELEP